MAELGDHCAIHDGSCRTTVMVVVGGTERQRSGVRYWNHCSSVFNIALQIKETQRARRLLYWSGLFVPLHPDKCASVRPPSFLPA